MKEKYLKILVLFLSSILILLVIFGIWNTHQQPSDQENVDVPIEEEHVSKLSFEEARKIIEEKYPTYVIDSYHEEEEFFEFSLQNSETKKMELNCLINRYTGDIFENEISYGSGGSGSE